MSLFWNSGSLLDCGIHLIPKWLLSRKNWHKLLKLRCCAVKKYLHIFLLINLFHVVQMNEIVNIFDPYDPYNLMFVPVGPVFPGHQPFWDKVYETKYQEKYST